MTKEYKMPDELRKIFDKWIKKSCKKGKKGYSIYYKFNHGEYTVEYEDLEPFMQIAFEAGYKEKVVELEAENEELKVKCDTYLRENTGLKIHSSYIEKKLTYAKTIIQDLLDNSDEYARQRAIDFLKENK